MNKKLLSFNVVLAVLSCNNVHSMRRIQDPQIVKCAESERRSVRIVSNVVGNFADYTSTTNTPLS